MTTKLPSGLRVGTYVTAPGPNAAPDNDEPLPDAMYQEEYFTETMQVVRRCYQSQETTLVSGDSPIYYRDAKDKVRLIKPDCYVAFGVDEVAIRERNGYFMEEVGKPPDFALEIASVSTSSNDIGPKRNIYARLGIGEYWRFDATGGRCYGEPLVGERLVDGGYRRIEIHEAAGGVLWGHSETLGLELCWDRGKLRFYDPMEGGYLRNLPEAEDEIEGLQTSLTRAEQGRENEREARQAAERTAREEREARRTAERTAQEERASREAAEARERLLLEELRRRSGPGEPPEPEP